AAPAPVRTTTPAPSPAAVRLGRLSLEWVGGGYLANGGTGDDVVTVADVDASSAARDRRRATFIAVRGLADPQCFSFRTGDGRYLRHYELDGYTSAFASSQIFREDATYCPRPGVTADSVMLRSFNYPDFFLRWDGTRFGIGYFKDTEEFRTASSFRVRAGLARTV
ncbi:AbfB domain-containing protein, partial [Actinoplanes sp. NPDC024001]|uniref:AbfB domain-containing protein n=1 Tax=Actinoplanes sp. NPDC024001 TaxID=3154598 RepID=UPI0033F15566